jgi:hypothetical protein
VDHDFIEAAWMLANYAEGTATGKRKKEPPRRRCDCQGDDPDARPAARPVGPFRRVTPRGGVAYGFLRGS